MKHLLKILELKHFDAHRNCIWESRNILNTIHKEADLLILSASFNTSGITVPDNYYVGMDNRSTISVDDTLSSLVDEPSTNGYSRIPLSSSDGFEIALNDSSIYQATSGTITFVSGIGLSWGPVSTMFLATTVDNTGYLLSSVAITGGSRTVSNGQTLVAKMAITLQDAL